MIRAVMRPLRLVWVYPDLLSTYGDRGNVLMLERRARLRGLPVEVVEVNSDQPVPRDGDIYLMGGGEDLPQTLATRRLLADGGLHAAAERGAVVFAVCAGYQMLGMEFGGADGAPVAGTRPARHPQRPRGAPRGRRDRRRRRPRAERGAADRLREPPGRHAARPAAPGRWPAPRSAPATATGPRAPTRAGCSARTCTARRSSATPASPTCCCTGPRARCRRCRRRPRNWPSGCATSALPRSALLSNRRPR